MPGTIDFLIGSGPTAEHADYINGEAASDLLYPVIEKVGRMIGEGQIHTVTGNQIAVFGAVTSEKYFRELIYAPGAFHGTVIGTGVRLDFGLRLWDDWIRCTGISVEHIASTVPTVAGGGPFSMIAVELSANQTVDQCIIRNGTNNPGESKSGVADGVALAFPGFNLLNSLIINSEWGVINAGLKIIQINGVTSCNNPQNGFGFIGNAFMTLENSYAFGNTADDIAMIGVGGTFESNASEDASADDMGGSGHLINRVTANEIVNGTAGSEDINLKVASTLIGAGVAPTAGGVPPFALGHDIYGHARGQPGRAPSIGAHEPLIAHAAAGNPQFKGSPTRAFFGQLRVVKA